MARLAQVPHEPNQLRGIVEALHSAIQHRIVAGLLAFLSKTPAGDPQDRIEPIDGSQELGDHLHEPVSAPDVRELMP